MLGEMGGETESAATPRADLGGRRTPLGGPGHNGERGGKPDERSSRMADQVGSGTVHDAMGEQAGLAPQTSGVAAASAPTPSWKHEAFHGRPVSWAASIIIIIGFLIGGVALITGPTWWAFWTGAGVTAVGCILGMSIGIFNDWY